MSNHFKVLANLRSEMLGDLRKTEIDALNAAIEALARQGESPPSPIDPAAVLALADELTHFAGALYQGTYEGVEADPMHAQILTWANELRALTPGVKPTRNAFGLNELLGGEPTEGEIK